MGEDRWSGGRYKQSSDPQERLARWLLESLELEGTERVLDLGCGDGRVTAELARRVPEGSVLGLDASESMIASCVQDHTHTEGLRFEVAHAHDPAHRAGRAVRVRRSRGRHRGRA